MIDSLIDTDLYKLTMAQAVLRHYPEVMVRYDFINRDPERKFTRGFVDALANEINALRSIRLRSIERQYLDTLPYLTREFVAWFNEYRFDPSQVSIALKGDQLSLFIEGPWCETIFWEVPLLALISERYHWEFSKSPEPEEIRTSVANKRAYMDINQLSFVDFGTRRRYSSKVQYEVVDRLNEGTYLRGTSNLALAKALNLNPVGTMAHEWIQGISALEGLRHANRFAMERWHEVYKGRLGIALTDTFGSKAFFRDFNGTLARLYDGVRHDSGDPRQFTRDVVGHYRKLDINTKSKMIVFSDGLNPSACYQIQENCVRNGIRCSFGIGTNLSCDIAGVKPMNIVIKLREVNGIEVVKLSDVEGKVIGSPEAVATARRMSA